MHGGGSKLDITRNNPPARILDLTRSVRRADRVMTGVDRVEFAYLDHLLDLDTPVFGLVRSKLGFVLLDRTGLTGLRARLAHGGWGRPDLLARMTLRRDPSRAAAEADLRRLCLARTTARGLPRMLRRHLARGTHYLNIGHSNFTDRTIAGLREVPDMRIAVLLHDTIPLDAPEFQRPGSPERFGAFLRRVGRWADLVICNSAATEAAMRHHLAPLDLHPQSVVAHLGVDPPVPGAAPAGPWQTPYFVTLGTIEPRKNHALLLDIWDDWAETAPDLLICGRRGWENQAVFDRLDRGHPRIHELPDLDDAAVFALLQGAAGLLFPSLAEGYGLPPIEAAALGTPVLCNTLPVYREVLGDIPVYAATSDRYLWEAKIRSMAKDYTERRQARDEKNNGFAAPGWNAHFNTVLRLT